MSDTEVFKSRDDGIREIALDRALNLSGQLALTERSAAKVVEVAKEFETFLRGPDVSTEVRTGA